jgi:TRAP-type C4-dicarboxylate transport system permease small subunit
MQERERGAGSDPADPAMAESWPERLSNVLCQIALLAMVVLTTAEVIARLFHTSLEITDEVGGYLLAALTFLSLPVALVGGALHRVEFIQARLQPKGRLASEIAFTLLGLVLAFVLLWQIGRLVLRSHASEAAAPTILGTPLWIPQSAMLIGTAVFAYSLLRLLARDIARWRRS